MKTSLLGSQEQPKYSQRSESLPQAAAHWWGGAERHLGGVLSISKEGVACKVPKK